MHQNSQSSEDYLFDTLEEAFFEAESRFDELLPKGEEIPHGKDFCRIYSSPKPAPEGAGLRRAARSIYLDPDGEKRLTQPDPLKFLLGFCKTG